jgi:hypothetical protein
VGFEKDLPASVYSNFSSSWREELDIALGIQGSLGKLKLVGFLLTILDASQSERRYMIDPHLETASAALDFPSQAHLANFEGSLRPQNLLPLLIGVCRLQAQVLE